VREVRHAVERTFDLRGHVHDAPTGGPALVAHRFDVDAGEQIDAPDVRRRQAGGCGCRDCCECCECAACCECAECCDC
jgi:hypothetical protein